MSQTDIFAEIARKRSESRLDHLYKPQPPELPEVFLPTDGHDPAAAFKPTPKMSTPEELRAELLSMRDRYAPYMSDRAPQMESPRRAFAIRDFDWRIESDPDKGNLVGVLAGEGDWEEVTVPHYGPPIGKNVTYYRTTFTLEEKHFQPGALFIRFAGVDYKAHVFINGNYLGSHTGFFAPFEFDFTPQARPGNNNLLVKVENDFTVLGNDEDKHAHSVTGDKIYAATGPGYDDSERGWHHCPAGMGIYQDVTIEARPRLFINDIFVRPLPDENQVEAWLEITNCDRPLRQVKLDLSVYGRNFDATVIEGMEYIPAIPKEFGFGDPLEIQKHLAAGRPLDELLPLDMEPGVNCLRVRIDMGDFRWWTPAEPWLYQLQVELCDSSGTRCDTAQQDFGMRTFSIDDTEDERGLRNRLMFNGKPVRLRGANTMGHLQRCVMEKNFEQLRDDILLAKIANMNFLRLTQRPVQPEIYDYADRLGIMIQTDLPLFGGMRRSIICEGIKQAEEMERLIRAHPSCILVSYINEPFPNGNNKPQRLIDRKELEAFMKACDVAVRMQNPDRAIKPVDGDYDPPAPGLADQHCYSGWYNGHGVEMGALHRGYYQYLAEGTYYGCGEFGAEGLDSYGIMQANYPFWLPQEREDESAWTPNSIAMAQIGKFHYMFYDTPSAGVQDWINASWRYQAWSTRTMTEAFRRDFRMMTYAIHLFIDAWPCGWMKSIMDVGRNPKDAYFTYRDCNEPIMVSLRSDRMAWYSGEEIAIEAWVCNDLPDATEETLMLRYLLEMDGEVVFAQKATATLPPCSAAFQGYIKFSAPAVTKRSHAVLRLALVNSSGEIVHHTEQQLSLFPEASTPELPTTALIGGPDSVAAALASDMKLPLTSDYGEAGLILIGDYAAYRARQAEIDESVSNGATAIFMELEPGFYELVGTPATIKLNSMNAVNFVSRKTGHPLVEGFETDDFKMWYDESAGYVTPIAESTLMSDAFTPILTSGNLNAENEWGGAITVGEKKSGNGKIVICQLKLKNRLATNPTAALFAARLLSNHDRNGA